MKSLMLALLLSLSGFASSAAAETITLTTANMVYINGPINAQSVSKAQNDLKDAVKTRGKGIYPIYLVLNTPGGSIFAGIDFINYAKTVTNVKTIVMEAASMGAMITESLPFERLITSSGVLMFHRPWLALEGQFSEGEVESRLAFIKKVVKNVTVKVAARMGLTQEQYDNKVKDEYWLVGQESVDVGAMDRVVEIECSQALQDAKDITIKQMFIFEVEVESSRCPLLK